MKKKSKTVDNEIQKISKTLQQVANCLAYQIINSGDLKEKSHFDTIPLLLSLGFDKNSIASVFGTSPDAIKVELAQIKERAKSKKEKGDEKAPQEE